MTKPYLTNLRRLKHTCSMSGKAIINEYRRIFVEHRPVVEPVNRCNLICSRSDNAMINICQRIFVEPVNRCKLTCSRSDKAIIHKYRRIFVEPVNRCKPTCSRSDKAGCLARYSD